MIIVSIINDRVFYLFWRPRSTRLGIMLLSYLPQSALCFSIKYIKYIIYLCICSMHTLYIFIYIYNTYAWLVSNRYVIMSKRNNNDNLCRKVVWRAKLILEGLFVDSLVWSFLNSSRKASGSSRQLGFFFFRCFQKIWKRNEVFWSVLGEWARMGGKIAFRGLGSIFVAETRFRLRTLRIFFTDFFHFYLKKPGRFWFFF